VAYRLHSRIAVVSLLAILLIAAHGFGGEIHDLLSNGEIEKAKALLAKDPKLKDARDDYQQTPLHIAADTGQLEIVKLLIKQGADVNARAYNQFAPLHFAKDPEMVKLLIAHKADLEAKGAGETPLQSAARYYMYARMAELAEAEKWRTITKILLDAGAYYGIYSAVSLDDLSRVKALLNDDPTQALDRRLMLHAVQSGRTTCVKLLLDHKADPTDAGYGGLPLLFYALKHPEIAQVLIKAGADPKVRLNYRGSGWGPQGTMLLHHAAEMGQVETAKLLIQAGVEVDCRSEGGNTTPLWWAAYNGQVEMVKFLLKNKANIKGEDGDRAMTGAASRIYYLEQKEAVIARYKSVIAILREAGVPVDIFTAVRLGESDLVRKLLKEQPTLATAKDNDLEKKSILAIAVGLDLKDIVVALLDAGAPIESKDESGYTALHNAAFWGREEIAKLLIGRRADVNARAMSQFTPLHEAARCKSLAVAKLLLAAGADVNAKDDEGKTPLAWAKESNKEIIELLKKHGGK
jgi:ankyrin repeat protein